MGPQQLEQAVAVARQAQVKRLALFHHDTSHDDAFLAKVEQQCRQQFATAFIACEGIEITF